MTPSDQTPQEGRNTTDERELIAKALCWRTYGPAWDHDYQTETGWAPRWSAYLDQADRALKAVSSQ